VLSNGGAKPVTLIVGEGVGCLHVWCPFF
jgi:hypothetical protein